MFAAGLLLSSCAAMTVAIEKRHLDVQTKMSRSIILPPADVSKKTVWADIRNTSDKDLNIENLKSCIAAKGYRLVSDPNQANYLLQVNILQFGKSSPSAARQAMHGGFGGPLAGGATGALIGGAADGGTGAVYGALAGGLLGGLIETVANASVKDTTFAGVTDVQISVLSTERIVRSESSSVRQGTSSVVRQSAKSTSDRLQYHARIVSTANKANLDFAEAQPQIEQSLARVICGVF